MVQLLPNNFKEVIQRWFPTDSEAAPLSIRNPKSAIRPAGGGSDTIAFIKYNYIKIQPMKIHKVSFIIIFFI